MLKCFLYSPQRQVRHVSLGSYLSLSQTSKPRVSCAWLPVCLVSLCAVLWQAVWPGGSRRDIHQWQRRALCTCHSSAPVPPLAAQGLEMSPPHPPVPTLLARQGAP